MQYVTLSEQALAIVSLSSRGLICFLRLHAVYAISL